MIENQPYVLAFDLGTSALKAVIYAFNGLCIASESSRYEMMTPESGWAEANTLDWKKALHIVLSGLKAKARLYGMKQTLEKLRYLYAFRIVPNEFILRYGNVRNIAVGEVFVHANWSSSPDLLYGLALRRSPWIFDPRYLRRPFYYRSEANPLMTRFVLENIVLCPIFCVYQFGHEIKSARYEIFYKLMRRIGLNCEQFVCANGVHSFDVLASFIFGDKKNCESMKPEGELLSQLYSEQQPFSAIEIAKKYHLPLIYVQEEILPIILSASEQKKTNIC